MVEKSNLIKLSDGYLVLKDEFAVSHGEQIRKAYDGKPTVEAFSNGAIYGMFDVEATIALRREMNLYEPPIKATEEFRNDLNNTRIILKKISNLKLRYGSEDTEMLYSPYIIPDKELPEVIKDIGFKIDREVAPYKMSWNDEKGELKFINLLENKEENPLKGYIGGFTSRQDSLTIRDIVLLVDKEDYDVVMSLFGKSENRNVVVQPKHIEFSKAYDILVAGAQLSKETTIAHETKHIVNGILLESRRAKISSGSIGLEDFYKLCEHDEKSATLADELLLIEKYHKSGNYNDLSIFKPDRYKWLHDSLERIPTARRKDLLMNMDFVVAKSAENWDMISRSDYTKENGQIENLTKNYAENAPISKIANDNDEYLKQRSLMYRFNVYNPDTKKHEHVNLFRHVRESASITNEKIKTFFYPLEVKVKMRKMNLEKKGLTKKVIDGLRKEFSEQIDKSISKADDFYINKIANRDNR